MLRKIANGVGLGGWLDAHGWLKVPESKMPRGSTIHVRGQVESMNKSFLGLGLGILFAIVLVYFLMVVNFQSWTDPFIIIMALPGALCGIAWMLFLTGTTLNVPSLMGAIMSIGVATSNSILLITFANDERCADDKAWTRVRRRPGRRPHPPAPRPHDRPGHDHRHGSDGDRIG